MKPFDLRLLRTVPEVRRPVALLAVVGVAQGVATIGLAFALAALVVAVVSDAERGGAGLAGSGLAGPGLTGPGLAGPGLTGPGLTGPALIVAALFAVRAGLGGAAERSTASAGVEVSAALREALVIRWLRLPAERRPGPDRATALAAQGAASVEPYAARFLPALVAPAVVPALAVLALFWVDWVSALVVVITLPLLPVFAALIGHQTATETEQRWHAMQSLSGHFLDVMRGLPTLVAYGRAERQVSIVAEVSERHRRATMRTLRTAFLSSAALELLASISVAIVAVTVGIRLTHGSMTLEEGLLAILLAPEAYWPVRRVGAEFHAAADGAEALAGILPELTDGVEAPAGILAERHACAPRAHSGPPGAPFVRVRDLTYRYPGTNPSAATGQPPDPAARPAQSSNRAIVQATDPAARSAESPNWSIVQGVSFDVGRGLTVLTGPSGAGKSTLLELVAGLRTPTSGTVDAGRAHLVSQRPFLPAGTLRDVLRLGNDAPDHALWGALRAVGLEGYVAGLPAALGTTLGDDGVGLSAGQRARLALARATLSNAPVLLVDEPTAHLDTEASALVHGLLVRLARQRTVLVATHRFELLALADHHIALRPAGEPPTHTPPTHTDRHDEFRSAGKPPTAPPPTHAGCHDEPSEFHSAGTPPTDPRPTHAKRTAESADGTARLAATAVRPIPHTTVVPE
ncbi:MAG: thiol reductant ABC exporter subunit CydD [Dermatophilaceae bacterium]